MRTPRPEHAPSGRGVCLRCGLDASTHVRRPPRAARPRERRPEHLPLGNPCGRCKAPAAAHGRPRERPPVSDYVIGLDGEGAGRAPHVYTFLAAADDRGNAWQVAAPGGLTTVQCLNHILSLPGRALLVGFAFNYDLTMILRDLPDESLWDLFHEESRARLIDGRVIYKAVRWKGYRLNYQNRRFSVRKGKAAATVWDFFRFFGCAFVQALTDWQIAGPAALERMIRMKGQRAKFSTLAAADIQAYCVEECVFLSKLGRKLIDSHAVAGLPLKTYNGPGSTASVLLDLLGIRERRGVHPAEMDRAIWAAFFGGRFELSRMGPVEGPVFSNDLSSAYPYAATTLPCLVHGRWRWQSWEPRRPRALDAEIAAAALACVHWTGGATRGAWGALPVRSEKGSIVFPLAGQGGWTWREEYLAAVALGAEYRPTDAWLYETRCSCPPPFARLAEYYRERVRWGADGAGRVLKTALASTYGKTAQSKGLSPPFQSWIFAGNITSATRAALLNAIRAAANPWDVLMLATDGVYSRRPLVLPRPLDTGTADLDKPLGSWKAETVAGGVFLVRPGIYFPLDPADTGQVKARGLGRRILAEQSGRIVEAFQAGAPGVRIDGMVRFVGAKSALHKRADGSVNRSPDYGDWLPHGIDLTFAPAPKRRAVLPDGRLVPFPYTAWESFAYSPATVSPEAAALSSVEEKILEQPDGDFSEGD